jgi:phosphoribosylformylglycinamidine cyclo-ligase
VHITGDGFANLGRLEAKVGYRIETLPEKPAIFGLIQETGNVDDVEMYRVFNMGIGMVAVVAPEDAERSIAILGRAGVDAMRLGVVVQEPGITIEPAGLVGEMSAGDSAFRKA